MGNPHKGSGRKRRFALLTVTRAIHNAFAEMCLRIHLGISLGNKKLLDMDRRRRLGRFDEFILLRMVVIGIDVIINITSR